MKKISYNFAARFYGDLKDAMKKLEATEAALARESERTESLLAENGAINEKIAELTRSLNSLAAENAELKQKLKKITTFHSYRVGKSVVEAKKTWGAALGGMIGSWRYYSSLGKEKKERATSARDKNKSQ